MRDDSAITVVIVIVVFVVIRIVMETSAAAHTQPAAKNHLPSIRQSVRRSDTSPSRPIPGAGVSTAIWFIRPARAIKSRRKTRIACFSQTYSERGIKTGRAVFPQKLAVKTVNSLQEYCAGKDKGA
jgi:hypothetical protein